MSSQSDIGTNSKLFQSSWGSGKSEKRKKHAVSSLIRQPGSTPGTVLFAGKNPASQNSSFCKERRFSDGNHMLSKVAAQPPPAYRRNLFSLAATKAALLRKHTVWPEQSHSQFIHPAHTDTGSTGGERGRKKLVVKRKKHQQRSRPYFKQYGYMRDCRKPSNLVAFISVGLPL